MNNSTAASQGIKMLLEKCRNQFRRPENLEYYERDNYKEAEKKYVKFCLHGNVDH